MIIEKFFSTPILLIGFTRTETLKKVIASIRKLKPANVYAFCDGPKVDDKKSYKLVQMVQETFMDEIDWDCNLKTNFQSQNLGMRKGPKYAIDWFFSNEESGIILEDDIVAVDSFFEFCEEMLQFYKDDKRVAQICGLSRGCNNYPSDSSYYFSKFPHIWGWATWARSWNLHKDNMLNWDEIKGKKLLSDMGGKKFEAYWTEQFDLVKNGSLDVWDLSWAYTVITQNMVSVVPKNNLISNIGFGELAEHMSNFKGTLPETKPLSFPLIHPIDFIVDDSIPSNIAYQTMNTPQYKISLFRRMIGKIRRIFSIKN
jgi:hypothetical protein